jgi:hypothetical protein
MTDYARIGTPVLTDLFLDFGDIFVYDIYPDPLPDLFLGRRSFCWEDIATAAQQIWH